MSITVNTNVTSLIGQKNLTKTNSSLSKTLEHLSTGYKINHAADDAAGLAIAEGFNAQVKGTQAAYTNTQHGINYIQTADGDLGVIQETLQRVRELAVQAANGIYSTSERNMIADEVKARLGEITRVAQNSTFSGMHLLDGSVTDVTLQVGANSGDSNRLSISDALVRMTATALNAQFSDENVTTNFATGAAASNFIAYVDTALNTISQKRGQLGAYQNRLETTLDSLSVREENLAASLSTIRDADVAQETSALTKLQILQQASSAVLTQANSLPSIALSLLQG
jgi:flagellin